MSEVDSMHEATVEPPMKDTPIKEPPIKDTPIKDTIDNNTLLQIILCLS